MTTAGLVARPATDPRSRYYLCYAPHENPGGICVAYKRNGTQGGVEYMFYKAGPRLQARICIARAVPA
ncbi:hypothetical protein [Nonomuraea sp. JJY05]|uniref:hypothetical protein n=1 Tax=Nonomuraea sp. JJY05 TaxID=3350255 RepID=UPI00373E4319